MSNSKYKYFYLLWLLPLVFMFLSIHQTAVYYSLVKTYKNGSSYTAEPVDFQMKQIATLTTGYIILRFETGSGQTIQRKLSLPVEMGAKLRDTRVIPIRYRKGAFQEIVIMPTYDMQRSIVIMNVGIAAVGLLITFFIALAAHRYARRKLNNQDPELEIETID